MEKLIIGLVKYTLKTHVKICFIENNRINMK